MIVYEKFWQLCNERGISTYFLRKNGISSPTVYKLKENGKIGIETIDKLCQLLHCQPGELMEYVEDAPGTTE